jgi:hypothetical protein
MGNILDNMDRNRYLYDTTIYHKNQDKDISILEETTKNSDQDTTSEETTKNPDDDIILEEPTKNSDQDITLEEEINNLVQDISILEEIDINHDENNVLDETNENSLSLEEINTNENNNFSIKDILKNIIYELNIQEKYKIKLKDETINLIIKILDNNPELFDLIEKIMFEIIIDNDIILNLLNLQNLLNNIAKIFDTFSKLNYVNNLFEIDIFCNLLDFIFCILLEENKENIQNSDILLEKFVNITENFCVFINLIKIF